MIIFILFLLLTLVPSFVYCQDTKIPESAFMIDTIQAVIFGQSGTQVITYSDVVRPSLSGESRALDDLIFERLVYLDAQKYKIMSDDEAVDKYLAMVQKENNLTRDQLYDIFASAGYSPEEGRSQFQMLQTVNAMLDFKIRSQIIVPRHLVENYYNENPVFQEAAYKIQVGVLPYIAGKETVQKKALAYMAKRGKAVNGIEWGDGFWIKKEEVTPEKQFIFGLKEGGSSMPKDLGYGFEVYRLVEKKDERLIPFDERYKEIADILRRPIYGELMDKYKKNIFDTSSILYFKPSKSVP